MIQMQPCELWLLFLQHEKYGVGKFSQFGQIVHVAKVQHLKKRIANSRTESKRKKKEDEKENKIKNKSQNIRLCRFIVWFNHEDHQHEYYDTLHLLIWICVNKRRNIKRIRVRVCDDDVKMNDRCRCRWSWRCSCGVETQVCGRRPHHKYAFSSQHIVSWKDIFIVIKIAAAPYLVLTYFVNEQNKCLVHSSDAKRRVKSDGNLYENKIIKIEEKRRNWKLR